MKIFQEFLYQLLLHPITNSVEERGVDDFVVFVFISHPGQGAIKEVIKINKVRVILIIILLIILPRRETHSSSKQ